jgi:hypothetical protein
MILNIGGVTYLGFLNFEKKKSQMITKKEPCLV